MNRVARTAPASGGGRKASARPRKREKRDEPQDRQRDATSPRAPSGENRRGGAKPRGRNGIDRPGGLPTEAEERALKSSLRGGSGRSVHVDGGEKTNPMRGRPRKWPGLWKDRSGEERRSCRSAHHPSPGDGANLQGPSRASRATGKAEEGAGKANDPQLEASRTVQHQTNFRRVSVSNLEDPVDLTRAARASAPRCFRST